MTIWARIAVVDNTVHELINYNPVGNFAEDEDFRFTQVSADYEKWVKTGWVIDEDGVASPPLIEDLIADMKAKVADKRWEAQTRGVVVGGTRFLSDPPNLGIVSGAIQGGQVYESMAGPGTFAANWKAETGFVVLNLMGLVTVGMFGLTYTQECFSREGAVLAAIDAAAETEGDVVVKTDALLAAFLLNIDAYWPSNVYVPPTPPEPEPEPEDP